MSMGDVFFWIGVVVGILMSLVADLALVAAWYIYEARREKKCSTE